MMEKREKKQSHQITEDLPTRPFCTISPLSTPMTSWLYTNVHLQLKTSRDTTPFLVKEPLPSPCHSGSSLTQQTSIANLKGYSRPQHHVLLASLSLSGFGVVLDVS